MSYILRLFDGKDNEVGLPSTVVPQLDARNYPEVGEMIGQWEVIAIIKHTEAEHWVRVKREHKPERRPYSPCPICKAPPQEERNDVNETVAIFCPNSGCGYYEGYK